MNTWKMTAIFSLLAIVLLTGMAFAYPPVDPKHKQNVCGANEDFQNAYDAIQKSYLGSYDKGHYADTVILSAIKNLAIMEKCIGDNTTYKEKKNND